MLKREHGYNPIPGSRIDAQCCGLIENGAAPVGERLHGRKEITEFKKGGEK